MAASSLHLPEVVPGRGLEIPFDGLEPDPEGPEPLPEVSEKEARHLSKTINSSRRFCRFGKRMIIGISLGIAVIIAVVVGAVVGRRARSSPRRPVIPTSPSDFNSTVDTSQRILLNTSIASALCPNGDRWLFVQDEAKTLRAAQYASQSATWVFSSNATIPGSAKLGSSLDASCVWLDSDLDTPVALSSGPFITLAYFDDADILGQSLFNGGSWYSPPTTDDKGERIPPWPQNLYSFSLLSLPATSSTRLSISTHVLPSPWILSSVATYQSNGSVVIADLLGSGPSLNTTSISNNFFPQFQFASLDSLSAHGLTTVLETHDPLGFVCLYNSAIIPAAIPNNGLPWTSANVSVRFLSSDLVAFASYGLDETYQSNHSIEGYYSAYTNHGFILSQPPNTVTPPAPFSTTDLAFFSLSKFTSGVTYVSATARITLVTLNGEFIMQGSSTWRDPIPYAHISSSAHENATTIYTYYQVNSTTIAEALYDLNSGFWSSELTHIHIPVDGE